MIMIQCQTIKKDEEGIVIVEHDKNIVKMLNMMIEGEYISDNQIKKVYES